MPSTLFYEEQIIELAVRCQKCGGVINIVNNGKEIKEKKCACYDKYPIKFGWATLIN